MPRWPSSAVCRCRTTMAKSVFVHLVALCLAVSVADTSTGSPALPLNALGGPCVEFGEQITADVGWRLADCLKVLTAWNRSLSEPKDLPPQMDENFFTIVAEKHRAAHFPCEVSSMPVNDGAGSRTIRYISDWILARQLGCDWTGPAAQGTNPQPKSSTVYCHSTVRNETSNPYGTSPEDSSARCISVDWMSFFNLEQYVAQRNTSGPTRDVEVRWS